MPEHGRDKISPIRDDEIAGEPNGELNAGRSTRAREEHELQPPGEDQPENDRAPGTTLTGTPTGMTAAVQAPLWSRRSCPDGSAPKPARGSSTTARRAFPRTAVMRRSGTACRRSPGKARHSRHSTTPSSVTQRAAPDQGARLVVAAPHEAAARRDRVVPGAADEGGEDRVRVPARCAHPGDVAAGTDECAPLAVGDQGVLPQRLRLRGAVGRAHETR